LNVHILEEYLMRIRFAALGLIAVCVGDARADKLDDLINAEMKRRAIPGLSIAIIDGGKVVRATGYGVTEKDGKTSVTPSTLFQAGSISKPVSALGALRLVEQGKLTLDEDVNGKLVSWRLPSSEFSADNKVTLRQILSHSAGLTVHGFPGYATDAPLPSVVQVLNGEAPANTAPVRVDIAPGSRWRYSGGGYTVAQVLMTDVTGRPFPELMHDAVLKPLGMNSSSFLQPPPAQSAHANASGHSANRQVVPGRWHVYPEMAAAGLWTTPSDLARFAIGIQQALAGTANPVISRAMARQMLTDQKNSFGLGLWLQGTGNKLQFSHGGRDEGFDANLTAYSETGQGAVIMINANDNSRMMQRLLAAIGHEYHWPGSTDPVIGAGAEIKVDPKALEPYAGRYELANNMMIAFGIDKGRLVTFADGLPDEELIPLSNQRFRSTSRNAEVSFEVDGKGSVTEAVVSIDWAERHAPRIGPLMRNLKPQPDPNTARTAGIKALLDAVARGESANLDPALVAPGWKADLGTRKVQELNGIGNLVFLLEQDVSARPFERHRGKVAKVLSYQATAGAKPQYLLIYLTAENQATDYDLVQE
jgi:CubicO group peptidase (beta-lactamase class C family)